MKILLITDTHLHSLNIDLVKNIFKECIDYCKKNNIDRIIHLGDFFETRASLTYEVIKGAIDIFKILQESKLQVDILAGNHDRPYTGKTSYLSLFKAIAPNINFIEDIDAIQTSDFGLNIYLPNWDKVYKEKFEEANFLSEIKDCISNVKILFAHCQLEDIPAELQAKVDLILMGHIHDREQLTDKAWYIGSAYQQNFAEDNYKGFTILNWDGKEFKLELHKTNFQEFFVQKVDLNVFTEEEVKQYILDFKEKNPNKFLKIIFEGYNKDITLLKEFCKSLDIEVGSNIQNLNELEGQEIIASGLSKEQLDNYFEEFYSQTEKTDALELLKNIFKKEE